MTQGSDRNRQWDVARERLKAIEAGLAGSLAPGQNVIEEAYRRRAVKLAQRHAAGTVANTLGVLVFALGKERYAMGLSELAEVFPYKGCTAVPGAPPAVLGVINVRGEIGTVVDLCRILGLPQEDTATGYVLMLRRHGMAIGFKVDQVEQVRQIDPAQLISRDAGAAPIAHSSFVKALTAETLILIDTDAILSHLVPPLTEPA